jgi:hypothetical protein
MNLKERVQLGDLHIGADGQMISEWVLEKQGMKFRIFQSGNFSFQL